MGKQEEHSNLNWVCPSLKLFCATFFFFVRRGTLINGGTEQRAAYASQRGSTLSRTNRRGTENVSLNERSCTSQLQLIVELLHCMANSRPMFKSRLTALGTIGHDETDRGRELSLHIPCFACDASSVECSKVLS